MNAIATGDLNSQEVLDTLKINGIEKFNPDDPNLPENVKERLDEVRKSGGEIEAFYDKTTNKIFIKMAKQEPWLQENGKSLKI